jgi:hypothetical protein
MRVRLSRAWEWLNLPAPARRLRAADRRGLADDPGADAAVGAMLGWLARAQDRAADGALPRHFDLSAGWGPPCAGATGLAVPVLLLASARRGDPGLETRAARAHAALAAMAPADGGFGDGGGASAFATGQAMLGLAAGLRRFGSGGAALEAAGRWLVARQDGEGRWPEARVHDTSTAWALLEADALLPGRGFAEAAGRALAWALTQQRRNGWMANCCTDDPVRPLSVTIGHAVRGFLECHRLGGALRHLDAAVMAGWALVAVQRRDDGSLPGRLTEKWEAAEDWSGLAGDALAAICWTGLHAATGDAAFRAAAAAANRFIRRTLALSGAPEHVGAVRGSFPVDGDYARFRYDTRAALLALESHLIEA